MTDTFLTLEEAGVMLGGTERPYSRDTIERLIAIKRLRDNGAHRKLRRVLRSSVEALIREIENGGSLWHASENPATVKVRSMKARKDRAVGSPPSPMGTGIIPFDGPPVARRPRRSGRNS